MAPSVHLFNHDTEPQFAIGSSMLPARDSDELIYDALDQLRHDLKTPLTAIHGRAQLLARSIQRSSSLADDERMRLSAGLTSHRGGGAGDGHAD